MRKKKIITKIRLCITAGLLVSFLVTSVRGPLPQVWAQDVMSLPPPGTRVALSLPLVPALLKGLKIYPQDPLRFDFILDQGDQVADDVELKNVSERLVGYFLAALTVPEKDLWVNLSPYEKDRIVPESFGRTVMGRDLLAQDYLLKQITASVLYPESATGKVFWQKVYAPSL